MPININNTAQTCGAVAGVLAAIGGGILAIEGHYAKAEALTKLELRVDQKIAADRGDKVQERIWRLDDRYPNRVVAPLEIQQQWRELEKEHKDIQIQLNVITDKNQQVK